MREHPVPKRRSIAALSLARIVLLIAFIVAGLASALAPTGQPAARAHPAAIRQGADPDKVQAAVTAAGWPQQGNNWCGVATIAAIAHYRQYDVSQQDVAAYLNSPQAVSAWGSPSGPRFAADISRDFGTDPRALAAGLHAAAHGGYHQYVGLTSAFDATAALAADLVRTKEPISVTVYHGMHSVMVADVWASGDPLADPSSITALDVWDPGCGLPGHGIQPSQVVQVPIGTWLTSALYWGRPYEENLSGSTPLTPDPAVGPYAYDPTSGNTTHLWNGHYVYIRPDDASDPASGVSLDWSLSQSGVLIQGFHGEKPTGYTGPTVTIGSGSEQKVIMSDTSVSAPGFWSEAAYPPAPASYAPVSAIAWTGTDTTHRLNVMLSADGLHYDHKIILSDTSFTSPSVAVVPLNGANIVVLAWTGTDTAHSLNILYDVYGTPSKKIFPETSSYGPSIAAFGGQIWLAWAGTDPGHSLNVLATGPNGLAIGAKRTLWQYHSTTPPALTPDAVAGRLLLSWRNGGAGAPSIGVVQSADGQNWSVPAGAATIQPVATTCPNRIALNPVPAGMASYYHLWVSTDPAAQFLVASAASPGTWSGMTRLDETAVGQPLLGYAGQPHRVLVAWTGTDPAHHLNVASVAI